MILLRKYFGEKNDDILSDSKKALATGGIMYGASKVGEHIILPKANKAAVNKFLKHKPPSEDTSFDNLKKIARDKGVDVVEGNTIGSKYVSVDKDYFDKNFKKYVKTKEDLKALDDYLVKNYGKEGAELFKKGRSFVYLDRGGKDSYTLAHELGHEHYMAKGPGKAGKLNPGRLLHNARKYVEPSSSPRFSKLVTGGISLDAFRRGYKSVKVDNETGDMKVKKKDILKSAGIGAIPGAIIIGTEAAASRKGLQLMKKAGASKEVMSNGRSGLGKALLTYTTSSLIPVVSSTASHGLGVLAGTISKNKESVRKKNNYRKKNNK